MKYRDSNGDTVWLCDHRDPDSIRCPARLRAFAHPNKMWQDAREKILVDEARHAGWFLGWLNALCPDHAKGMVKLTI